MMIPFSLLLHATSSTFSSIQQQQPNSAAATPRVQPPTASSSTTSPRGTQEQEPFHLHWLSPQHDPFLTQLFRQLCTALHCDYDACRPLLCAALSAGALRSPQFLACSQSGLLPPSSLGALAGAQAAIAGFLQQQQRLSHVLILQRRWRAVQLRRRYLSLHSRAPLLGLHKTFREFFHSEQAYSYALSEVVATYLTPVRAALGVQKQYPLLPIEIQDLPAVFSNVEDLHRVHRAFVSELYRLYRSAWPFVSRIGALFLEHVALRLSMYRNYTEQFWQGSSIVSLLAARSDPKVSAFAKALLVNLQKPISRLEEYEAFITRLLNDELLLASPVCFFCFVLF